MTQNTQEQKQLLDLAFAHITQHTNGHIKSEWSLEKNMSDEKLHTFPNKLNEKEMFSIFDFAKKYELKAFNTGVKFGKEKTIKVYEEKLKVAQMQIDLMKAENERLAQALENVYAKYQTEEI